MKSGRTRCAAVCLLALLAWTPARAIVNPGQPAPAFTKSVLDAQPWPTASLSDFAGKVLILHILGYD